MRERYGILGAAMVELSGQQPELSAEQQLAARKAMVPAPYVEAGLERRKLLTSSGPLKLPTEIENLYTVDATTGTFKMRYTEKNKSYKNKPDDSKLRVRDQEPAVSERTAIAELTGLDPDTNVFEMNLSLEQTNIWGINFVGTIHVKHPTGEECTIYLPGVLTFDPAGITGDSHASERIGWVRNPLPLVLSCQMLEEAPPNASAVNLVTLIFPNNKVFVWKAPQQCQTE